MKVLAQAALAILALGAMAACASQDAPPPSKSKTPPPPAIVRPPPVKAPPPKASLPPDTCGARPLQYLVGRPRTEIPVPLEPGRRRVVCSTCPMTMDFSAYRQTIIYDAESGRVTEVRCG